MLTGPAVYLRVAHVKKGLENSFTGPYKVLERFDKYFMIETSKSSFKISIDRLKPAYTLVFVNDCKTKKKNDFFISRDKKSISIPATTVTKDSRRWPCKNNFYFTDTSNKAHPDSFNIDRQDHLFQLCNLPTKKTTTVYLVE